MKRAVICFTRVPQAGRTKTRLIPLLGAERCAQLQWAFLRDLADVYSRVEADLYLAYTSDPEWETLKSAFPHAKGFFPQVGEDLGARMDHAIKTVLAMGYGSCILTGSDLPMMTEEHLESGFTALQTADIALGPTTDGGYYLVGMKRPCSAVFEQLEYGGSTVYEATCRKAEESGLRVSAAKSCEDVDTPEDLAKLRAASMGHDTHTARFLKELTEAGILL
jgi:rSAM/selenodomain-associated transferase 1